MYQKNMQVEMKLLLIAVIANTFAWVETLNAANRKPTHQLYLLFFQALYSLYHKNYIEMSF